MGVTDFDTFEQQFLELISEFQSLSTSEHRLRDTLRAESTRAEAAEALRDAAERATTEARSGAAAATAGASQAATALARAQDELTGVKLQVELAERQRTLLEERCTELSGQVAVLERELQQLKPVKASHAALQRQYTELQERIHKAVADARSEASRLESELRRVERCASAGAEIRERARLAAAAHARERKLAAAELQHTAKELLSANAEIARLSSLVAELQCRLMDSRIHTSKGLIDPDIESLAEMKATLEAERDGSAKLEKALAAAVADNAVLAAKLNATDNVSATLPNTPVTSTATNNPLDLFLAD